MKNKNLATPVNQLTTKKNNAIFMHKVRKVAATLTSLAFAMSLMTINCFAVSNDAGSFNTVVAFIVTWVQRIGGVIAFVGAIQFGMAFKNDDADGKTRGLMTLASGFIVVAICIAYDTLFKQA
jgi:hypothetical protein